MTFADNLQAVMNEKKLSQADVERKTGISQSVVSRYVRGKIEPTLENAIAISIGLKISLNRLAFGKQKQKGA